MSLDAAVGLLACPHCSQPLDASARPVRCPAGHSFDVAKQGYLNLLGAAPPANADTAPMVEARARFLATGAYSPIAALLARCLTRSDAAESDAWLEVGAGTGWYLAAALDAVPKARGIAMDVSVAAARRAARAHPRAAAIVADVWRPLPVLPTSLDAIACVFAPRNLGEFARVLRPGGRLVVVVPNSGHLAALRSTHGLLGIGADKDERLLAQASSHFEHAATEALEFSLDASADQVRDLIGMGPNAFHEAPADPGPARVDVSVSAHVFMRAPGPLPSPTR